MVNFNGIRSEIEKLSLCGGKKQRERERERKREREREREGR